jgi:hypothetical protein
MGSIELKMEELTGEVAALRGEIKGESLARDGQIEGLRSEIRVYSLAMGVILSIIAAGFWHVLPAGH